METYTLELRQKDATTNNNNGDWESIVQEKILVEENDSIVMKSTFIDTEASSNQKINIQSDLTLDIEYCKYWNYYYNPDSNARDLTNTNQVPPTGNLYTLCDLVDNTSEPVGALNILYFEPSPKTFTGGSGGFDLEVEFQNPEGTIESFKINVPSFKGDGNPFSPFNAKVVELHRSILFRTSYGLKTTPNTETMASKFHTSLNIEKSEDGTDDAEKGLVPKLFKQSVNVPKGAYSPPDLCNLINTQMTQSIIDTNLSNPLYGNPLLQPTNQYFNAVGFRKNSFDEPDVIKYIGDTEVLVGSNQYELSYVDTIQKFTFNQIHTPLFDSDGTVSVEYKDGTSIRSAYSGIYFTHLGAKDKETGNDFDFWGKLLGFNVNDLYPKSDFTVYNQAQIGVDPNIKIISSTVQLEEGKNITGGKSTISGLLPSSKSLQTDLGGFDVPIGTTSVFNPTNDVNNSIEASSSVFNNIDSFGYFLIEVNAKFLGKYITKDQNRNNIRGIVGRYYEVNSYTSGGESDSLLYTHKGNPMFLESFRCRILDSDKNLASNLGNDNTIFLQLVKAPKEKNN